MKSTIAFTTVLFLLAGCAASDTASNDPIETSVLLEEIRENNRSSEKKEDGGGLSDLLYDYSETEEPEAELEEFQSLSITSETERDYTRAAMIENVSLLHTTLKNMYPLYEFQGGDQAFESARDHIGSELQELGEEEELTERTFTNLLAGHYDFINDKHFVINGNSMSSRDYRLYRSEDYAFFKDENREFRKMTDEDSRLRAVNGDREVEAYLLPGLSEDGEIVYYPGVFTEGHTDVNWALDVENSEGAARLTAAIRRETLEIQDAGRDFELAEKDGVPWLQLRSMTVLKSDPHDHHDVVNSAKELREAPYFVLDLRSNIGGQRMTIDKWLEAFFGRAVSLDGKTVQLFSAPGSIFVEDLLDLYGAEVEMDPFNEGFEEEILAFGGYEYPMEPFFEIEQNEFPSMEKPDTEIYILMDNHTASAAELLALILKKAGNTTLIGVQSAGAVSSGDALPFKLPNTHIPFEVPVTFTYSPELMAMEGKGIQPDLWVSPDAAEQRVLQLLKKHSTSDNH
ncbi:hypothetical protein CR205_11545 [Alteribacter lacisalsi]|uniref:Tail specific protease domain-containing protein n=1 Tax=Alteribacter lacisalsi TaxID=2045244 RepID=A0A2W0HG42_9BACI|nr:S41 family peptidase [Alteribacter lacisalsi]PYZ96355.1 hypothetical protein CR205_11545 [Alteribacter lacisalsi]